MSRSLLINNSFIVIIAKRDKTFLFSLTCSTYDQFHAAKATAAATIRLDLRPSYAIERISSVHEY